MSASWRRTLWCLVVFVTATSCSGATITSSPTSSGTPSIVQTASPSAATSPSRAASASTTPSASVISSPTTTRTATPTTSSQMSNTASWTSSLTTTPSPSGTRTPTPISTSTPSSTVSRTGTHTQTPSASMSRTTTPSPSITRTATASPSSTRTATASPSATRSITSSPSLTPTNTASSSNTRSSTSSRTPTATPTSSRTATSAPAAVLSGRYVRTAILSLRGYMTSADYDASGRANFSATALTAWINPNDPFEGFMLQGADGINVVNNEDHAWDPGSFVPYDGPQYGVCSNTGAPDASCCVQWLYNSTSTASSPAAFTLIHRFCVGNDDTRIAMSTTIAAQDPLPVLYFARYINPDPGYDVTGTPTAPGNTNTLNVVYSSQPIVVATGVGGRTVGVTSPVAGARFVIAQTDAYVDTSSNVPPYDAAAMFSTGNTRNNTSCDCVLAVVFRIPALVAGTSMTYSYSYVFGRTAAAVVAAASQSRTSTPAGTPSVSPSAASTASGTQSNTASLSPGSTPSLTPSAAASVLLSDTSSASASLTSSASPSLSALSSATGAGTPTASPSMTLSLGATPSNTADASSSAAPDYVEDASDTATATASSTVATTLIGTAASLSPTVTQSASPTASSLRPTSQLYASQCPSVENETSASDLHMLVTSPGHISNILFNCSSPCGAGAGIVIANVTTIAWNATVTGAGGSSSVGADVRVIGASAVQALESTLSVGSWMPCALNGTMNAAAAALGCIGLSSCNATCSGAVLAAQRIANASAASNSTATPIAGGGGARVAIQWVCAATTLVVPPPSALLPAALTPAALGGILAGTAAALLALAALCALCVWPAVAAARRKRRGGRKPLAAIASPITPRTAPRGRAAAASMSLLGSDQDSALASSVGTMAHVTETPSLGLLARPSPLTGSGGVSGSRSLAADAEFQTSNPLNAARAVGKKPPVPSSIPFSPEIRAPEHSTGASTATHAATATGASNALPLPPQQVLPTGSQRLLLPPVTPDANMSSTQKQHMDGSPQATLNSLRAPLAASRPSSLRNILQVQLQPVPVRSSAHQFRGAASDPVNSLSSNGPGFSTAASPTVPPHVAAASVAAAAAGGTGRDSSPAHGASNDGYRGGASQRPSAGQRVSQRISALRAVPSPSPATPETRFEDFVASDVLRGAGGRGARIPVDLNTALRQGFTFEVWRRATHSGDGVQIVFPRSARSVSAAGDSPTAAASVTSPVGRSASVAAGKWATSNVRSTARDQDRRASYASRTTAKPLVVARAGSLSKA